MSGLIPVVVVAGPTASGKTGLSIRLADRFNAEIISADSMQIYRGMDVATAKPDEAERKGIPHHLMGVLSPDQSFSVAAFCERAHEAIRDIHQRGRLPLICGGTGLYIDSLLQNISFAEKQSDPKLRGELQQLYEAQGVEALLEKLSQVDFESYERLKEQRNPKRIVRSLEVFFSTGMTQTELNRKAMEHPSPYRVLKIGLKASERQFLYERINRRVDLMVEKGLVEEAKRFLSENLSETASMAIGYKELAPYFSREKTLTECLDHLKMQTRRYAKRQLTWFLRDRDYHWFDIDVLSAEEIEAGSSALIESFLSDENEQRPSEPLQSNHISFTETKPDTL